MTLDAIKFVAFFVLSFLAAVKSESWAELITLNVLLQIVYNL